jgi:hypothetical protein
LQPFLPLSFLPVDLLLLPQHHHRLPLHLRNLLSLLHHKKIKLGKRRMILKLAQSDVVLTREPREPVNRWLINTRNAVR